MHFWNKKDEPTQNISHQSHTLPYACLRVNLELRKAVTSKSHESKLSSLNISSPHKVRMKFNLKLPAHA